MRSRWMCRGLAVYFLNKFWLKGLWGVAWMLLISQHAAHADVWGYVDAKGTAHFAAEPLDERYALFVRGGGGFDSRTAEPDASAMPRPVAVPTGATKLLAFFDVSPSYKAVKHLVRAAATRYGLEYELLQALIAAESGFDADIVSPKGAIGLMQVMPATAQRYGVEGDARISLQRRLADPRTNVAVGARYLSHLLQLFGGQRELALAAYNAGEGAVRRAGNQIPPYKETQDYVKTVLQLHAWLKPPAFAAKPPVRVRMELAGAAPADPYSF